MDLPDPYAGGRLESSGSFTVDLDRLSSKLGRSQLRSHEDAVLRFLAAAVAGGATWFRFESRRGGYTCEWDAGAQLDPMSELALGLHTVRGRRGQVTVTTGATTRVDARVPWRPFRRSELQALVARGGLAPLEVQGFPRPGGTGSQRTVRVGKPPLPMLFDASRPGRLEQGGGYFRVVGRGQEELCFVLDGVSYVRKSRLIAGLSICWWTDEIKADLARERVVEDEALKRLCRALAVEGMAILLEVFSPEEDELGVAGWLAAQAFGPFRTTLESVPLFPRADGSYSTASQLREQFARDGYLGVSTVEFVPDSTWPGSAMVLDGPALQAVKPHFPHLLDVSHLHNARRAPRLPADQQYLTRIPLTHSYGELGLRLGPHEAVLRRTDGTSGVWQQQEESATCADVAGNTESLDLALPDLYRALRYQLHSPENSRLVTCYLVDCLHNLVRTPARLRSMATGNYVWNSANGGWRSAEIRELIATLQIPTEGGESIPLLDVHGEAFFADQHDPPPPSNAVALSRQAGYGLVRITGAKLRDYLRFCHWTADAVKLVRKSRTVAELLKHLWNLPGCVLRQHYSRQPRWAVGIDLNALTSKAELRGFRSWSSEVSTDLLLLAMLDQTTAAEPELRDALIRRRGVERWTELQSEPAWPGLHHFKARVLTSQARYAEAQEEALTACSLLPDSFQTRYIKLSLMCICGDFDEALSEAEGLCYPSSTEVHRALLRGLQAEACLCLQDYPRARIYAEDAYQVPGLTGFRSGLLADLELALGNPEQALTAATEALALPHRSNDAYETLAKALTALGRPDEAREAYRNFLRDAYEYGLHAYGAEERLALARAALEG